MTILWPLTAEGEGEGDDGNAGGGDGTDGTAAGGAGEGGQNGAAAPDGGKGTGLTSKISPDAGAGDGAGEGGGDQSEGESGRGGDGEGDAADAPAPLTFKERPDWVPEQFHDTKTGVVDAEAMAKSWTDLRAKMSRGEQNVPAKPEGYKLEIPENMARVGEAVVGLKGENGEDGPIVEWFRQFAHEKGFSQDTATELFNGYLGQIDATLPEPIDGEKELAKLGPKGQVILDGQATWINGLKDKGVWTPEEHEEMLMALDTAVGVSAIVKLRTFFEGYQIPAALAAEASGSVSADDLRAEMAALVKAADEGDLTAPRKYDALMQKYNKLYGTEPAGTSVRPGV